VATAARASDLTRFCSLCARQAGLDPAGQAYAYDHMLAVEIPLPWPLAMYDQPGTLPDELLKLRQYLVEAYQRGEPLRISALAIAPDPAYTVPGRRRVISYRRPAGAFASFEQQEYLIAEQDVGRLCWALLMDHAALPGFAEARLPSSPTRDLLICTHGSVDAACAKFGFPTYRQLRQVAERSNGRLRAWRASHFGGHVFAPTLIDMPEFRYWAYMEREEAELLALRSGDVSRLRKCYRGWGGLESPLAQAAERELFLLHGWAWLGYLQQSSLLAQGGPAEAGAQGDGEPSWAELRIDYAAPDGTERGAYRARVELSGHVETPYNTGSPETYAYPQYTVTSLERIE
jgi:hypothetical protein